MHNLKQLNLAMAVFLLGFTQPLWAGGWDKSTVMSTADPIVAGGKVLPPGSYVWKLLDSPGNRHTVQISDQLTGRVEATIIATGTYRRRVSSNSRFQFWETPEGLPPAVRSWFYPGDFYGQAFAYPEELMASLAQARPVSSPLLATSIAAKPRLTARAIKVPSTPRSRAMSEGSWAEATDGIAPISQAAPARRSDSTVWGALRNLPLTATLASLVGVFGAACLIVALLTYVKRRNNHSRLAFVTPGR